METITRKEIQNKKQTSKRSLRAKKVAREVLASVREGTGRTLKDIAVANGYAVNSAIGGSITGTLSYKEEIIPMVNQMTRIQNKILAELEGRDVSKERFLDLTSAHKNLLHDKQLTQGKATENVNTTPNIIVYTQSDPLAKQLKAREVELLEHTTSDVSSDDVA